MATTEWKSAAEFLAWGRNWAEFYGRRFGEAAELHPSPQVWLVTKPHLYCLFDCRDIGAHFANLAVESIDYLRELKIAGDGDVAGEVLKWATEWHDHVLVHQPPSRIDEAYLVLGNAFRVCQWAFGDLESAARELARRESSPQKAAQERTPDSETDTKKPALPDNPAILQLMKRIKQRPAGETETSVAREFTSYDETQAQSLLRGVRRYRHLMD